LKRKPVTFGAGLISAKTLEVQASTIEVAAATLPSVQEGTGGNVSEPVVTGAEHSTGSHAMDPSENGSMGNDYPTGSTDEEKLEEPHKRQAVTSVQPKTEGKESGQASAEAEKRPKKKKIPTKAEGLQKAAAANKKTIEDRKSQEDLEADEDTLGCLRLYRGDGLSFVGFFELLFARRTIRIIVPHRATLGWVHCSGTS
jgi:hypothetical protein